MATAPSVAARSAEQLSLLGLSVLFVLALLAPGEQLTGAIEDLPLSLAHLYLPGEWRGRRQSRELSCGH